MWPIPDRLGWGAPISSDVATTTSSSRATRPATADVGWDVDALRAVWERQQRQVGERIGVLEAALAALAGGGLEADLRCEAERAAHTLAGSLGMFGFTSAADAARRLERELAATEPRRAPALSELLEQLRAGVGGPVRVCEDSIAVSASGTCRPRDRERRRSDNA